MKHLILKLLFLFLPIFSLKGQTNLLDSLSNLSAKDYDLWAFNYIKSTDHEEPLLLKKSILSRLDLDKYTSDNIILELIKQYEKYENHKIDRSRKDEYIFKSLVKVGNRYKQLHELVDDIIEHLYERNTLEYNLKETKIRLYFVNHEYEKEIKLREELVADLENLEFKIKAMIYKQALELGNHYAKNSQIYESEKNYSKILSNRFYTFNDPVKRRKMQGLYLSAGENILKLRKHDLSSLKNTYFFPAAMPLLDPIKQEYLEKLKN